MKSIIQVVLIAVLGSVLLPTLHVAAETTSAADATGWDPAMPWYWTLRGPDDDVVEKLKSGHNVYYVKPEGGQSCHPVLKEYGFGNGRREYGQDICKGRAFHVWGITSDFRWVVGSVEGRGERFFFPTYRLTTFIYEMPAGTKLADCTGLASDITMNAVPNVNRQIRLAKGADKFDVQISSSGAWLLDDVAFAGGRRECLRHLQSGEWVVVRYTLNNGVNGDPVWAYVRVTLLDGTKKEGLVRTMDLVLSKSAGSQVLGATVVANVSVAKAPVVKTYTVKAGDSLWKIAKDNGTSVEEIVKLNSGKITNPRVIRAGWVLALTAN